MVGSLLKKANLSTPHRPSTCAAIFLFVDAASLWRAEIVKASLPEVNQFTGNCFRVVRIVLKITFLKLRYPGQRPESPSLSYYGSWAGLFFASAIRQGLGTANKQPGARFHVRNRPCAGSNEDSRQNK